MWNTLLSSNILTSPFDMRDGFYSTPKRYYSCTALSLMRSGRLVSLTGHIGSISICITQNTNFYCNFLALILIVRSFFHRVPKKFIWTVFNVFFSQRKAGVARRKGNICMYNTFISVLPFSVFTFFSLCAMCLRWSPKWYPRLAACKKVSPKRHVFQASHSESLWTCHILIRFYSRFLAFLLVLGKAFWLNTERICHINSIQLLVSQTAGMSDVTMPQYIYVRQRVTDCSTVW